ncbi:MAG TPA: outer membrane protein assembly factor BamE [Usitatibacter sp.]|nr:outer membrane protein assembly factor BamE [Usitatibacter sp.]
MLRQALLAALVLAAAGCASYDGRSLAAGAPESEVKGLMGPPAMEVPGRDGTTRLVYPKGPLGTQTFMADLGPDHRLVAVRNVLTDDVFEAIRAGMTEKDVLATIGPPGTTMAFSLSNTHAWEYRYQDAWGYLAEFSVTFDANGVVLSKLKRRLESGRDNRR